MPEPKPNFQPKPKSDFSLEEISRINTRLDTIKNIEITHLFKPLSKIIDQLKDTIKNCEYDLLIGEDASGRIPALVFKDILQKVYEENKKEEPQLLFMSGTRYLNGNKETDKKFSEYINTHALGKKKALLVTDFVGTGGSLSAIVHALKEQNIEYDIASVALIGVGETEPIPEVKDHLYFGSYGPPEIFHNTQLSGVNKNYGDVVASHANKHISNIKLPENVAGERTIYSQEKINEARKDAKKLAEILFEENFK